MRPQAVAVTPQVRDDDAIAVAGEGVRQAVLEELPPAAGEPVQQHERTALPDRAVDELQAVTSGKRGQGTSVRVGSHAASFVKPSAGR